jgi:hypothetical protein
MGALTTSLDVVAVIALSKREIPSGNPVGTLSNIPARTNRSYLTNLRIIATVTLFALSASSAWVFFDEYNVE